MSSKEIIDKLGEKTRFSSENQPANAGRKKNRFNHLRNKFELSINDVEDIIEFMLSLKILELEELMRDKDKTVIEKAFASAIVQSIKKGDLSQIEKLLDRKVGKVANKVDAKVETELNINITMPKNDDN